MVANPGFYTGQDGAPPDVTAPPVAPSSPVTVTKAYAIGKTQVDYFQGQAITQAGEGTILNTGLIAVIPVGDGSAFGIDEAYEDPSVHDFINTSSGVMSVEAKGADNDAYGYYAGVNPVAIANQGVVQVVSLAENAYGVWDYGGYSSPSIDNSRSGLIAIWAKQTGVGLFCYQVGIKVENEGLIEVNAGKAIGVYGPAAFDNHGSIIAADLANDGGSIGVKIGFAALYGGSRVFTNSGLIQADKAFFFDAYELSPPWSQGITIENTGKIVGDIDLSENAGADLIVNGGVITGSIECQGSSNAALTNTGLVKLTVGGTSQVTTVDNAGEIDGRGFLNVEGSGVSVVNETGGLIKSKSAFTLTTPTGRMTNNGVIEADGGVFRIRAAVDGTGDALVDQGTLEFDSNFTENVQFTGASGTLELARSRKYTGVVTGFSHAGGTQLDLRDIDFIGADQATFSGSAGSGVLTVADGTNVASIRLFGNYMASTFVTASDGHGGVIVSAQPASPAIAAPSGSV